jgi:TRAP-type C4-dicarboxylate transport system permease small subunit
MQRILDSARQTSRVMEIVSGIALTVIVLLTTADVILRAFGYPIPGTYEVVAIGGAVIIGFVSPVTSWMRGHIYVDFAINRLPGRGKAVFNVVTRCVCIVLFLIIGWNLVKLGTEFGRAQEVSLTLQIPLYPVAFGLGACFFILSFVLFCDILKIAGDTYE